MKSVAESRDGLMVEVSGVSSFVRGTDAVFYSGLDVIEVLDPRKTRLAPDDTSKHAKARLHLEAVIRKTALPQTEHGIALADSFLMDQQQHQLRPAELALSMRNPQPRLLIADVVGLGKTLEIGITLSELIRRGRGERILVVTPAHVLEQFQRELWTRFSLPLVRLDSTGIQRIQQEIPAGRNPFAHFKRVIVSVDTLKSATYGHHLENVVWDAVVIDESHNLVNKGTRNNRLAHRLAEQTDALILASATPHNGDAESFAELIRMLDPAAIADPKNYKVADLDHLYIRRTKTDREVRDSLRTSPGPNAAPHCRCRLRRRRRKSPSWRSWRASGPRGPGLLLDLRRSAGRLQLPEGFPLLPRSPAGILASRRTYLDDPKRRTAKGKGKADTPERRAALAIESKALAELETLVADFTDQDSAKLDALVRTLKDDLGVGPRSQRRVVVFSERVHTLDWLAREVPERLGFKKKNETKADTARPWKAYGGAVEVMHGDTTNDQQQQEIIDRFGRREEPVRLLFTGDIASEGVNLHHQCHDLIHYDLPWSLIRIEQRNGRIDRYGQAVSPSSGPSTSPPTCPGGATRRTARCSRSTTGSWAPDCCGARHRHTRSRPARAALRPSPASTTTRRKRTASPAISSRAALSSAPSSSRSRSPAESSRVPRRRQRPARRPGGPPAALGTAPVPEADVPHVFTNTKAYFHAAMDLIYPEAERAALGWKPETAHGRIEFTPPEDLQYRFRALPNSYLKQEKILTTSKDDGTLSITFDKQYAADRLEDARNAKQGKTDQTTSQWPNVSYVSDIHPVLDWVTDKVLARLRYDEAFVLAYRPDTTKAKRIDARLPEALTGPVYLLQGVYSNAAGKPTVVEWMGVTGLGEDNPCVWRMDSAFLAACGVGPDMPGRAQPVDPGHLQELVPAAVDVAEAHLRERRADYDKQVDSYLAPYEDRVQVWEQDALIAVGNQQHRIQQVYDTAARRRDLVRRLRTKGDPMLRVLCVLEPFTPPPRTPRSPHDELHLRLLRQPRRIPLRPLLQRGAGEHPQEGQGGRRGPVHPVDRPRDRPARLPAHPTRTPSPPPRRLPGHRAPFLSAHAQQEEPGSTYDDPTGSGPNTSPPGTPPSSKPSATTDGPSRSPCTTPARSTNSRPPGTETASSPSTAAGPPPRRRPRP
ncbi:DEAD/DEAH box helicase [Streptomyces sp. M10(2022)]